MSPSSWMYQIPLERRYICTRLKVITFQTTAFIIVTAAEKLQNPLFRIFLIYYTQASFNETLGNKFNK
jgi:hypothetical protein